MNKNSKIIILGAGISSLAAGYYLKNNEHIPIILEKDSDYGGLCGNFYINGFEFDRFVHFSFSDNEEVNNVFSLSEAKIIKHTPNPYNIYNKKWIKHPAQNNLFPLSKEEKEDIIRDFKSRPNCVEGKIDNYDQWLRAQFGNSFAEKFPIAYTRKYWMCEAAELETKWVGARLYQPSIDEVIRGCNTLDTPVTYYAKEMRYPNKGGYKSFLNELVKDQMIMYNKNVVEINTEKKYIRTVENEIYNYDFLISAIPLTELINVVDDVPEEIKVETKKLKHTSGYLVSVGLKTKNIPEYLWWYIYDEDFLPARVYSPSLKSSTNAPEGCSSLQLEIYCSENQYSEEQLYNGSIGKMIELGIINKDDILFVDIRFEKYANIVFDHHIYEAREKIRSFYETKGISLIGRFGLWDYLWSDQSFLSGKECANKMLCKCQ